MSNSFFLLWQVPITTGVRLAVGTPSPSKADLLGVHDERHPQNQQQILSQQSSHDEHKSASTAALLHQKSDVSEAAATAGGSQSGKGAAVKNVASPVTAASKKAGDTAAAAAKGGKFSGTADEHHDVGSGVKASAASLAHAAEHLKEATDMLQKKAAAEGAVKGAVAVAVANGTASAKKLVIKDSTPPPDLLAYSKKQGQPGDTIHVLFTSNGRKGGGVRHTLGTGIASYWTHHSVRALIEEPFSAL